MRCMMYRTGNTEIIKGLQVQQLHSMMAPVTPIKGLIGIPQMQACLVAPLNSGAEFSMMLYL